MTTPMNEKNWWKPKNGTAPDNTPTAAQVRAAAPLAPAVTAPLPPVVTAKSMLNGKKPQREPVRASLKRLVVATDENSGQLTESIDNAMQSAEASLATVQAVGAHLESAKDSLACALDAIISAQLCSEASDSILALVLRDTVTRASSLDAHLRALLRALKLDTEAASAR